MREDLETRDREFPNPTRRFASPPPKGRIFVSLVQPSRSEGGSRPIPLVPSSPARGAGNSVPAKGPGTSAEDSKSASRILKLAIASFKILAQKYF
jgi:hypothetical protein